MSKSYNTMTFFLVTFSLVSFFLVSFFLFLSFRDFFSLWPLFLATFIPVTFSLVTFLLVSFFPVTFFRCLFSRDFSSWDFFPMTFFPWLFSHDLLSWIYFSLVPCFCVVVFFNLFLHFMFSVLSLVFTLLSCHISFCFLYHIAISNIYALWDYYVMDYALGYMGSPSAGKITILVC